MHNITELTWLYELVILHEDYVCLTKIKTVCQELVQCQHMPLHREGINVIHHHPPAKYKFMPNVNKAIFHCLLWLGQNGMQGAGIIVKQQVLNGKPSYHSPC